LAVTPGLALLASFRGRDRVGGPAWALVYPVDQLMPPFDNELFRLSIDVAPRDPGSLCAIRQKPCRRRSQPSVVFRRALIQLLGDL